MTLLIDLGNTRIKWARWSGAGLTGGGAAAHAQGLPAVLDARDWPRPARVRAVSVAGSARNAELRHWVRQRWALEVEFLRPAARAGRIVNGYLDPGRLGADRWAAILGAQARRPGAAVIVDCGSAVTLDAVDRAGRHRGGLILPGLGLMRRSLHRATAQLPLAAETGTPGLGRDTASAIANGTLLALAASVDQLARSAAAGLEAETSLWLTGGDAPTLLPHLANPFEHAPDLVLEGLAVAGQESP